MLASRLYIWNRTSLFFTRFPAPRWWVGYLLCLSLANNYCVFFFCHCNHLPCVNCYYCNRAKFVINYHLIHPAMNKWSKIRNTARVCTIVFVGRCLATKVFNRQIAGCRMGVVGDHRVGWWWKGVMGQQNSCKTLTGVHSTMHLMHPN